MCACDWTTRPDASCLVAIVLGYDDEYANPILFFLSKPTNERYSFN